MATGETRANRVELPHVGLGVLLLVVAVIAAAWFATWWAAVDYNGLLMMQLAGVAPTDFLLFLALSGVMMVAMMLPSAIPMLAVYRNLVSVGGNPPEVRMRTALFTAGYFLVWTGFAAGSLVLLSALGLMGGMAGPWRYVPGVLLVAMGSYQLSPWKRLSLRQCRSPTSFVLIHWKSGRSGSLRMGLDHAAYCLGCCWLLMLVLFVAGAMSLLWMAVFTVLIFGEKMWREGEIFSKAIGGTGIAVGGLALTHAAIGL